jgi:hypothetical protein
MIKLSRDALDLLQPGDLDVIQKTPCPYCGELFYPAGLGPHLRTHTDGKAIETRTAADRERAVALIKAAVSAMATRGCKRPILEIAHHALGEVIK